ncbi:MAG: hypothetical protein JRJ29_00485 [Deltaproteobacteria bacterium]|nr:hypothetical protein [Deltaproteobacteria bacterium]MBW2081645.1 hypothetical protein [Deltaproteobacteria bacterium]
MPNKFTDDEITKQAYNWLSQAREADREWREFSKQDFDYYLGNQWSYEAKAAMEQTKRPALTINQIKTLIKLVSGYQRSNRYPIRVYGNEESDAEVADILEALILNIQLNQLYQYQDSQRFLNGIICGRGYMFGKIDYSEDWTGEIRLHARVNPRHVYFDRTARDITLSDAEFITWVEPVKESVVKHLLGDDELAAAKLAELQNTDWNDFEPDDWPVPEYYVTTNKHDRWWERAGKMAGKGPNYYKLLNVFYRTWENEWFVADNKTGELKKVNSQDEAKVLVTTFPEYLIAVQRQVKKIKSALVCGNICIDHKESTTSHRIFPIIPFFGGFLNGETFGLVRDLKDIQDFLNKRFSNYAHILNTQANSGWIGDEDAVDDWTVLENLGSMPGIVVKKKRGRELKRIDPPSPPGAEVRGISDGIDLVKTVSGINPDLLGHQDKDTSGRAIMLRQQQGYQILVEQMDNHRLATVLTAQWMIDAIQNNYTYEKTFRILLPDNQVQYLTINQKMVDVMTGVEKILNDVTIGKYDVAVADQAVSPSMRYLQFQELLEMIRETGAMIPPTILIKASSLPEDLKREILEELQAIAQAQEQAAAPPPAATAKKSKELPAPLA